MRARSARLLAMLGLIMAWLASTPTSAFAHGGEAHDRGLDGATDAPAAESPDPQNWWTIWAWEPGSLAGLTIAGGLYGLGLSRAWRASGVGRGIRRREGVCFAGGWLTLFVALVSPLHPLGQMLFSAHMTQHELLMLVAAPLIVLGRPTVAFLRALPARWAHRLGRFSNTPGWRSAWGAITTPFVAWILHAAVLWAWHAPTLFQATLHSEWVHAAQHLSFLLSALLFWWALIHAGRTAANYGTGVLYLFTTAVHSGLLGALLTFARSAWYPDYARTAPTWGMSALDDQQVGGLIMWVPACVVYIAAGLVMFAAWLGEAGRRAVRREAPDADAPRPRASLARRGGRP